MFRNVQTFTATTLSGLESVINTFFAANPTAAVLNIDFSATDLVASSGIELGVAITYTQGAELTLPYTVTVVSGRGLDDVQTQLNDIIALNEFWFYKGPFICNLGQRRRLNDWVALMVVGADAQAQNNWFPFP